MLVRQLPTFTGLDEDQLRAFYASCGISAETTENAIKVRRSRSANEELSSEPRKKKHEQQDVKA